MKRERLQPFSKNTIDFNTVHAFVQIKDALNGHPFETIYAKSWWFAVPNPKRNVLIIANTTGTWENNQANAVPLLFVVSDGIREQCETVNPFSPCQFALQLDGEFGSDVGHLEFTWEQPLNTRLSRLSGCFPSFSRQNKTRQCGKVLDKLRVNFTTVPKNIRNYCDS